MGGAPEWTTAHRQYYAKNEAKIQAFVSKAIGDAVWARAEDPIEFIGKRMQERSTVDMSDDSVVSEFIDSDKPSSDTLSGMGAVRLVRERWRRAAHRQMGLAKAEAGTDHDEELRWRLHKWLAGPIFEGDMYLSDLVTASLIKPLQSDPDESNQYLEKPYIRALGAYPDAQVILNTLQSDSFTEKLAASLWEAAKRLHDDRVVAAQLRDDQTGISKFFDDAEGGQALNFGTTVRGQRSASNSDLRSA